METITECLVCGETLEITGREVDACGKCGAEHVQPADWELREIDTPVLLDAYDVWMDR